MPDNTSWRLTHKAHRPIKKNFSIQNFEQLQVEKQKLKLQIKATGELFTDSLENTGGHAKKFLLVNVALPLGLFAVGAGGIQKFFFSEKKPSSQKDPQEETGHESWFEKALPFIISFVQPLIITNLFRLFDRAAPHDEAE